MSKLKFILVTLICVSGAVALYILAYQKLGDFWTDGKDPNIKITLEHY